MSNEDGGILDSRTWVLVLLAPIACYQASALDDFAVADDDNEPSCGDGVVSRSEHCEDGNEVADDGCTECRYDCRLPEELSGGARCYRLVPQQLGWREARESCMALGAGFDLGALSTLGERDLVMPLVIALDFRVWIGAGDEAVEGTFQWIDGEPFTYVGGVDPWNPGEPNNGGGLGEEDCVELYSSGLLNDQQCGSVAPYLCERAME